MAHPFAKIFEKALKKSTTDDNLVLKKAEEILAKGYAEAEVIEVLKVLEKGRIDEKEEAVIAEALMVLQEEEETF
jgi:hypothetical protein